MSEAKRKPAAFMSYSHADNDVELLTEFRERLSQEVSKQIGEEFPIFQDEDGVLWGQNWQERIETSLDEVTFFIPIITPGFFKSAHCRAELERFLARERQLNRKDLVLPVYYVDYPLLNDKVRRKADKLVEAVAARQYADWRDLRPMPFTSPQVEEVMTRLAKYVDGALKRLGVNEMSPPTPSVEPAKGNTETAQRPLKADIPEHVVDMHGPEGDYHTTIAKAVKAANSGDRILVRPGLYQESLVMNKPLEIIGEGDVSEIVVEGWGSSALTFATTSGRVVNLTLTTRPKQVFIERETRVFIEGDFGTRFMTLGIFGEEDHWETRMEAVPVDRVGNGLDIRQGRPEIEQCDISSNGEAGITIEGGAEPRLRHNYIHNCTNRGVYVLGYARAMLEDNDIDSNKNGVEIQEGTVTLHRNRIHDNGTNGILVQPHSRATLEDNDIFDNGRSGVKVQGGITSLRRNRITGNSYGIYVSGGRATIEDNDLRNNTVEDFKKSEKRGTVKLARNEGRVQDS